MTCTAIHVVIEMVIKEKGGVQVGHVCNLGYGKKKKICTVHVPHVHVCIGVHVHSTHVPHLQSTGTESLG